ncbi:MAG TPA: hypothetical protein VF815_18520, partial [Myxococcaceae bacterium]
VFEAAFLLHVFWNPDLRPSLSPSQAQSARSKANEFAEEMLDVVFEVLKDESDEGRASRCHKLICESLGVRRPSTRDAILKNMSALDDAALSEFGRRVIPRLIDDALGPVSHQLKSIGAPLADWGWIREQMLKMVAEGEKGLAITITPDGSVTIRVYPEFVAMFTAMAVDYENRVPVFDDLSGYGVMKIFSWDDLANGLAKF